MREDIAKEARLRRFLGDSMSLVMAEERAREVGTGSEPRRSRERRRGGGGGGRGVK